MKRSRTEEVTTFRSSPAETRDENPSFAKFSWLLEIQSRPETRDGCVSTPPLPTSRLSSWRRNQLFSGWDWVSRDCANAPRCGWGRCSGAVERTWAGADARLPERPCSEAPGLAGGAGGPQGTSGWLCREVRGWQGRAVGQGRVREDPSRCTIWATWVELAQVCGVLSICVEPLFGETEPIEKRRPFKWYCLRFLPPLEMRYWR